MNPYYPNQMYGHMPMGPGYPGEYILPQQPPYGIVPPQVISPPFNPIVQPMGMPPMGYSNVDPYYHHHHHHHGFNHHGFF